MLLLNECRNKLNGARAFAIIKLTGDRALRLCFACCEENASHGYQMLEEKQKKCRHFPAGGGRRKLSARRRQLHRATDAHPGPGRRSVGRVEKVSSRGRANETMSGKYFKPAIPASYRCSSDGLVNPPCKSIDLHAKDAFFQ